MIPIAPADLAAQYIPGTVIKLKDLIEKRTGKPVSTPDHTKGSAAQFIGNQGRFPKDLKHANLDTESKAFFKTVVGAPWGYVITARRRLVGIETGGS